jgi:putative exporter of polyketide antibiotics
MSRMSSVTRYGLIAYGVQGKMTRRLAAVVIGAQGLAVFFGALTARALAAADGSGTSTSDTSFLLIGSALAVLCILDAGLMRQPWGITAGWVLQIATLACAFIVPAMLPVGLLFGALWLTALVQGGTMDEHRRQVDAQWYAAQDASAPSGSAQPGSAELGSENSRSEQPGSEQPGSVLPGSAQGTSAQDRSDPGESGPESPTVDG